MVFREQISAELSRKLTRFIPVSHIPQILLYTGMIDPQSVFTSQKLSERINKWAQARISIDSEAVATVLLRYWPSSFSPWPSVPSSTCFAPPSSSRESRADREDCNVQFEWFVLFDTWNKKIFRIGRNVFQDGESWCRRTLAQNRTETSMFHHFYNKACQYFEREKNKENCSHWGPSILYISCFNMDTNAHSSPI